MSNTEQMRDDLDAYFDTFDEEERQGLARAEAALDLATLLYQARKARGWTQKLAAKVSGVKQQAISRWEHSHPNIQLDTLRSYLAALGYDLELAIKDAETGEIVATTQLPDTSQPTEAASAASEQESKPIALPQQPVRIAGYESWPWQLDDLGVVHVPFWPERYASDAWHAYYRELSRLYQSRIYTSDNQSGVAAMLLPDENKGYRYAFGGWQDQPAISSEAQPYLADTMGQGRMLYDRTIGQQTAGVSPMVQAGA